MKKVVCRRGPGKMFGNLCKFLYHVVRVVSPGGGRPPYHPKLLAKIVRSGPLAGTTGACYSGCTKEIAPLLLMVGGTSIVTGSGFFCVKAKRKQGAVPQSSTMTCGTAPFSTGPIVLGAFTPFPSPWQFYQRPEPTSKRSPQPPLIEPCVTFSITRLSDVLHRTHSHSASERR